MNKVNSTLRPVRSYQHNPVTEVARLEKHIKQASSAAERNAWDEILATFASHDYDYLLTACIIKNEADYLTVRRRDERGWVSEYTRENWQVAINIYRQWSRRFL